MLAGFEQVIINHAWLGEKIEQQIGDGARYGISIRYSAEGEALETLGGIVKALPLLGDDTFFLVNGDVWTDYSFVTKTLAISALAHLVLINNPAHRPKGDFGFANGRVFAEVDDPLAQQALTYSGMGYFSPLLFRGFDVTKAPLAPVLRNAMQQQQVTGEHFTGEWFDVGTPERLQCLNARTRG